MFDGGMGEGRTERFALDAITLIRSFWLEEPGPDDGADRLPSLHPTSPDPSIYSGYDSVRPSNVTSTITTGVSARKTTIV
jgi:hypothetical protein